MYIKRIKPGKGAIFMIRTDLAAESVLQIDTDTYGGVAVQTDTNEKAELRIQRIHIFTEQAARQLGKAVGRYITITMTDGSMDNYSEYTKLRCELIAGELKALLRPQGTTLVAGLGNRNITPDAVGPLCADRIFATRHIRTLAKELDTGDLSDVCAVQPGVLGQTGIEASDLIKAVCERVGAKTVIAVDALACADTANLGRTIQITDTGISPGSGVANSRKELSERTLGARCIAVGIPTVTDHGSGSEAMMVTPRNIDLLVKNGADYIAMAINLKLQPSLSYEDLLSLV